MEVDVVSVCVARLLLDYRVARGFAFQLNFVARGNFKFFNI